jgi:hypothetical protein
MTDETLEALRRLLYVPDLEAVRVARLAPNDVIVLEVVGAISQTEARNLHQQLAQVFGPERRILVIDEGMRLRVAREDPLPELEEHEV